MNSKPCPVPLYSVNVSAQHSNFCCRIKSAGPQVRIEDFHSDAAESLRTQLTQPQLDPLCSACDTASIDTRKNQRQRLYNLLAWPIRHSAEPVLRDLSISLDNVCASSCIACSAQLSTTIARLIRPLPPKQQQQLKFYSTGSSAYQGVDLASMAPLVSQVEILHLYGGEPLISPQWPRVIELICQHMPNLQVLLFNTGLNAVKPSWIDMLNQLNPNIRIWCTVSIDAPLDYNHWIRSCEPQQVQQGVNALSTVKAIKAIHYQPVIANYNVMALPEWLACVRQLSGSITPKLLSVRPGCLMQSVSPVWDPEELSANNLPPAIKQRVLQKLHHAVETEADQHIANTLYQTAIELIQRPVTRPWDQSLQRIELYPKLRGSTETFEDWVKLYLPS